jgi:hypothetical protein
MPAKKAGAKAAPRTPKETSQSKRIAELEEQIKLQAWCFEEFKHQIRLMMAQAALSNPAVQQQLSAELANRMAQRQQFVPQAAPGFPNPRFGGFNGPAAATPQAGP